MTTAQDQQSREAYEDGKWYWVEREGWHGEPPTIAPAFYKANCDSWYSHVFSGISTPYLKVLEPCEMRNAGCARTLPAGVICYVRPGATLPRRMGWETCAATDAGALAVHADGRALDVGVEPVAWTVASGVTNWARDFSKYKTQHYVRPVFTASQALAMGRVPVVPVPQSIEQMAADRYKVVPSHNSMFYPCAVVAGDGQQQLYIGREVECQNMARKFTGAFLDGAFVALTAAAPRPPAAQEVA